MKSGLIVLHIRAAVLHFLRTSPVFSSKVGPEEWIIARISQICNIGCLQCNYTNRQVRDLCITKFKFITKPYPL